MNFIKQYQQKIALTFGFAAVAALGFMGGMQMKKEPINTPTVSASSSTINYTQGNDSTQTATPATTQAAGESDCGGKIKGSSSHIYHLPGDAFYAKTTHPIACFDTEAEAQAAGFRKSK